MHTKQRKILKLLVEINGRRFSEMFKYFEYEDKFPYHLKQLVKKGYIKKRDKLYFISKKGIRETTKFNTRELRDIPHKTLRILMVCSRSKKFLLYPRFKEDPSRMTYYVLPGGAPIEGETVNEAAQRLLKEKFSVRGRVTYRSTHHYTNLTTDGSVLFDNICLVLDVDVTSNVDNRKNWYSKSEIRKLANCHPTIKRYILNDDREMFSENSFTENYGFEDVDLK